jgi:hypothetical protein
MLEALIVKFIVPRTNKWHLFPFEIKTKPQWKNIVKSDDIASHTASDETWNQENSRKTLFMTEVYITQESTEKLIITINELRFCLKPLNSSSELQKWLLRHSSTESTLLCTYLRTNNLQSQNVYIPIYVFLSCSCILNVWQKIAMCILGQRTKQNFWEISNREGVITAEKSHIWPEIFHYFEIFQLYISALKIDCPNEIRWILE